MTIQTAPLPRPFKLPRAKYILFAALAAMYVYVLWTNEMFLVDAKDPEWQHIAPFKQWLLPHGLAAAFALFLGPLQFSERLRRKYITAHKVMGYLYIAGCTFGAPIGIYIQWFEEKAGHGSQSFTMATVLDAGIWIFATAMALVFVWQRKIQQHRIWMTRSFACALIFLEVRLIGTAFAFPPAAFEWLVWACVAAAFPLADLVLQIEESLKQKARPVRAVA
jgi:hypothetical protein